MADGTGGSVIQDSNGYDEPYGGQEGANHMNTDYGQQPEVKQTRRQIFHEARQT